jgi:hypothetical protein
VNVKRALVAVVAVAAVALAGAHYVRVLAAEAEIAWLEQIPVLDEDPA